MAASPICLIQWLRPGEHRETKAVLEQYAHQVSIYHADVLTKEQARSALAEWFDESASIAQYCFLGAHGVKNSDGQAIGIGASGNPDEFVSWEELWNWFAARNLRGGLWLGACSSSDAASALSPFLSSGALAIRHFYSFSEAVYSPEIEQVLRKLVEFTEINGSPDLDLQLGLLRNAVQSPMIELYYPANTLAGQNEFVNVDQMPAKIGKTFSQLLGNVCESEYYQ